MMLLLSVRGRRVAIPVGQVVEHLRPLPVEAVRGPPSFVLGMGRVRGEAIPVVDLGRYLAGDEGPSPRRWVVVRAGARHVALGVDEVEGVRRVDTERLAASPPLLAHTATEAVEALGVLDASLLVLLRAARVLDAGTWAATGS